MAHSAEAMEETFLMSNISPQLPVFNRGIWKSLEKLVRDWGEKERIYIVTGPVFKDNKGKIGRTGVTVPGFFYKVVYAPGARQMIAFVLPNTQEKRQLRDYAVTVDSVERLTNIDKQGKIVFMTRLYDPEEFGKMCEVIDRLLD